jgi:hypothetical protein
MTNSSLGTKRREGNCEEQGGAWVVSRNLVWADLEQCDWAIFDAGPYREYRSWPLMSCHEAVPFEYRTVGG